MDRGSAQAYRVLMGDARVFVVEVEMALKTAGDPAAVGAAVTVELCGHWEHEGPCRRPHNNAICPGPEFDTFRNAAPAPVRSSRPSSPTRNIPQPVENDVGSAPTLSAESRG
jgi:hypothetical protein